MDLTDIKAEAEKFFEWPVSRRTLVSYQSAMLFAWHIKTNAIEKLRATTEPPLRCGWHLDGESFYESECANAFEFNDAGPKENGFRFCPYCGKPIDAGAAAADDPVFR